MFGLFVQSLIFATTDLIILLILATTCHQRTREGFRWTENWQSPLPSTIKSALESGDQSTFTSSLSHKTHDYSDQILFHFVSFLGGGPGGSWYGSRPCTHVSQRSIPRPNLVWNLKPRSCCCVRRHGALAPYPPPRVDGSMAIHPGHVLGIDAHWIRSPKEGEKVNKDPM